jgi:hypothetical protein
MSLQSGKVVGRAHLPADPENVAVGLDKVVVASPDAGAVTLLDLHLKKLKVLRGFGSPHIVLVDPLRTIAYVTDDARGELDVIGLGQRRVVGRLFVGAGAHHMAFSPGSGHRLWIALGEHARGLVLVDVTNPLRPWVVRRIPLTFVGHDLAYAHNGRRIWVTSGVGSSVHLLDAQTGSAVARIQVGSAPQHGLSANAVRLVQPCHVRKPRRHYLAAERPVDRVRPRLAPSVVVQASFSGPRSRDHGLVAQSGGATPQPGDMTNVPKTR